MILLQAGVCHGRDGLQGSGGLASQPKLTSETRAFTYVQKDQLSSFWLGSRLSLDAVIVVILRSHAHAPAQLVLGCKDALAEPPQIAYMPGSVVLTILWHMHSDEQ